MRLRGDAFVRPAYKTVRFWVTLVAVSLTAIVGGGFFPVAAPYLSAVLAVLAALGYKAGRVAEGDALMRDPPKPVIVETPEEKRRRQSVNSIRSKHYPRMPEK